MSGPRSGPHRRSQITYEAEARALCRELLRCPSLSGQEGDAALLVEREMRMFGYDVVERDALGSVIGVVDGAETGLSVLFDAHLDVAPLAAPAHWRYDPYGGVRGEGRIWGRGAVDAKGSLAAALVAVGSLVGRLPQGRVAVAATIGGERIPGYARAEILKRYPAQRVIVGGPTNLCLGLQHKGRAGVLLLAEGMPGPSARPDLGVNAAYLAIEGIMRLRALAMPRDVLLGTGTNELLGILARPGEDWKHQELPAWLLDSRIVPDRCVAYFDRSLVRGETRETVQDEVTRALRGLRGVEARLGTLSLTTYLGQAISMDDFFPAWVGDPASPVVACAQHALDAAGLCAELDPAPFVCNGVGNAAQLGPVMLLYGPGEHDKAHGIDESLRVDELDAAVRGYRALAVALTAPSC